MLIFLRLFHLISSFLLIRTSSSSSVSATIETKCSTDNDCSHQLICKTETNTCVCPKPYFWREDMQACLGCAPGWLDLETNKCLLYAISPSPGIPWYEVEIICKDLLAQPMLINNTKEFQAIQGNIEYILNDTNTLAATRYFHQGAWIEINTEWIESYTWCNNDKKRDDLACVQIRQENRTNLICLQYISCSTRAQFICEAKPLTRLALEKNIAESKHSNKSNTNEEIIIRSPRQLNAKPTSKWSLVITTKPMANQLMMTTKKPSSWTAEHITSLANTGMQVVGSIATAFGSIFGKHPSQPESPPAAQPSDVQNYAPDMPQALASNEDENSNSSSSNLLVYGGIAGVILLIVIIISIVICVVCSKKKTRSRSRSSIRSTESSASGTSYE